MIRDFKHKGLQRFYLTGETKGIIPTHANRLQGRLERLDISASPDELPANWNCHPLHGELEGYFAIKLSAQWRLIFRFDEGQFCDLDYRQYH